MLTLRSLVGAVYLDSQGDFDVTASVLRNLGVLSVLERIIAENVNVLHPVSQLHNWSFKNKKTLEYVFEQEKGVVYCSILVDGEQIVRETEQYHGRASEEEVKFVAAEACVRLLNVHEGEEN